MHRRAAEPVATGKYSIRTGRGTYYPLVCLDTENIFDHLEMEMVWGIIRYKVKSGTFISQL